MLSLKSCHLPSPAARKTSIYDLPAELFDSIIEQCVSNVSMTSVLFPASFVSKRFRHAAVAILFRCVTLTWDLVLRRNCESMLDFLSRSPHIRRCVRTIRLRTVAYRRAGHQPDQEKLRELLPLLTNLQLIQIDYCDKLTVDLLDLIATLPRQPILSITDFPLEPYPRKSFPDAYPDVAAKVLVSASSIRHLAFREGLDGWASGHQISTTLEDLQCIMLTFPKLESLSLMIQPRCTFALKHFTVDHHENEVRHLSSGLQLRELRIGGCVSSEIKEECLRLMTAFNWSSIEKLKLSGGGLAELLLPRYGAEMTSLRSLHISLPPWVRSPRIAPEHSRLAVTNFLTTRSLVELELDGLNEDFPLRLVASTKLRKLRIHSWESKRDMAQANLITAPEIRELAELAPNLEHLMFDVGHVGKLWQPTAIPGVDVDVHLYQIFDALSQLRHLKILHFFPRYFRRPENGRVVWQQAIEDDGQAVRIFKHLKAIRPSLELLLLSSDNHVARMASIDPMSWIVCPLGETILLRVRQANKDYEQKQIWQGERRLRTEIRRYPSLQPPVF